MLEHINARYQTSFRMLGRYPVGESGAFRVVDARGARCVLKWSPYADQLPLIHAAARVTDQLRPLGYPTPRYVLFGSLHEGSFGIQHALPGRPREIAHTETIERLVALNDLQSGRGSWLAEAFPARPTWADEVVRAVTDGYPEYDYCVLQSLITYSATTSNLLEVLQNFVKRHADEVAASPGDDIVHFDFSHANILLLRERVVGVVDWEGVRAGDRLFDLATLLFYTVPVAAVHDRLWQLALERGRPGVLGVYLAHMIVRQVDFSIRHHTAAAVEHWLTCASGLLRNLDTVQ